MDVHLHSCNQRGVSLIEVMIALFVLSVGMLGISGLSIFSLKANRDALLRSRAVILAHDLADRMRANRAGAADYPLFINSDVATTNGCMHVGSPGNCNATQVAQDDVYYWQEALEREDAYGGLPEGSASMTVNAAAVPPRYTLTISWAQLGDTAGIASSTASSVSLDIQL